MVNKIILGDSNAYSSDQTPPLREGQEDEIGIWKDGKYLLVGCGECGSAWTDDMDSLKALVDFWNDNHA